MTIQSICVLGLGYIGLPTASTFAVHGKKVLGTDINHEVIKKLHKGEIHIFEPGLRELFKKATSSGMLTFSNTVEASDAFIIAVPTPFLEDKRADLNYVKQATESIVPHLKKGNLVILESTSPPLTTVNVVQPILEKSGLKAGIDFHLAYSPERVLPGKILFELINNARVIGGVNDASALIGRDLYRTFVKGEIVLTDATTAEMVKLMENTTRDINIAIANEFCRLAEDFGVDIWEAIQIANLHPRIQILKPGVGVGGHCISVDPWFLVEAAPEDSLLIKTAREINDSQPAFVCKSIEKKMGSLLNRKIAFLGLAFKPNVDDLRESPAITMACLMISKGAILKAYEPYKTNATIPGINLVTSLEEVLRDVDLIVLAVGHSQFLSLKAKEVANITNARIVFDAINGWSKDEWQSAGFKFTGLAKK